MKMFKLKKEAVKFFIEKHATAIHSLDRWTELGIDLPALDEVKPCYLTYGHKRDKSTVHLAGWDCSEGSHYQFTLHFPSMQMSEHDKFSKGKTIRKLMDEFQERANSFYLNFQEE